MLKVYQVDYNLPGTTMFMDYFHSYIFRREGESFIFVNSIEDSDIIPILPAPEYAPVQYDIIQQNYKNQLIVILTITHFEENSSEVEMLEYYKREFKELAPNLTVMHCNLNNKDFGIYIDFTFNLVKGAYTGVRKNNMKDTIFVADADDDMYVLNSIQKTKNPKKFFCINRIPLESGTMNERSYRRMVLQYYLESLDGYVNNPRKGIYFKPQSTTTEPSGFGSFHPAHNDYYEDSFVSIYVETLTHYSYKRIYPVVRTITEKTWNPLLKGHFILPYGYCGMLQDITSYGILLPDWIDYGYDSIENDIERFSTYMHSINKFLQYTNEELMEFFIKDKYILEYNRYILLNRPFDNLYEKIKKVI